MKNGWANISGMGRSFILHEGYSAIISAGRNAFEIADVK